MDEASGKLMVFFEKPFWVGVFDNEYIIQKRQKYSIRFAFNL